PTRALPPFVSRHVYTRRARVSSPAGLHLGQALVEAFAQLVRFVVPLRPPPPRHHHARGGHSRPSRQADDLPGDAHRAVGYGGAPGGGPGCARARERSSAITRTA